MPKTRIDEGLMKYIVKLFFPQLEREVLADREVQALLRQASQAAAEFNASCERIEKITGKDLSNLKFVRK